MLIMKQNTIYKNGQSPLIEERLSYDESITLAINKEKAFGWNMLYQNVSFLMMSIGILSVNPI